MPLSAEEQQVAGESANVGEFIDNLGRNLFQAERYDDLEEAFRAFLAANTAGTVAESWAHFFQTRLPALFTNYLITRHLEIGTELSWEQSFPDLIGVVNPGLQGDPSTDSLSSYIIAEIYRGRRLRELADEVERTCAAFRSDA